MAKPVEKINESGERFTAVTFTALEKTWRVKAVEKTPSISIGELLDYLEPIPKKNDSDTLQNGQASTHLKKRVIDTIKESYPSLFES